MNYISQIIYPLLTVFWWVPLLLLIPIARTAWFKGLMGEWLVNLSARLFLPSSKYTRFHNVTLNTLDGTVCFPLWRFLRGNKEHDGVDIRS